MFDLIARRWWVLALRGLAAILFGVLAWVWPGPTVLVLVILFGAYALVDGVFATYAAIQAARADRSWWPFVFEGVVGIAAGVIALVWPDISALALLYVIAAWAVVTGVVEIAAAIRLRREIEGEWWLALGGVASIAFGLLAFAFPGSGVLAVVWLIGTYAIVFGIALIALAFRLRSMASGTTHGRHSPATGRI